MIALDTNVLVRYMVQDDRLQSAAANRAIGSLTPDFPAFVSMVVLCEFAWVLRAAYSIPKEGCIDALEKILEVPAFTTENHDRCRRALRAYKTGNADFSDYLILETAHEHGCDTVLTFDKKALKHDGFSKP